MNCNIYNKEFQQITSKFTWLTMRPRKCSAELATIIVVVVVVVIIIIAAAAAPLV